MKAAPISAAILIAALLMPVTAAAQLPPEVLAKKLGQIAGWHTFLLCMHGREFVIAEEVDKLYRSRGVLKERDADRIWTDEEKQVMDIIRKQVDACDEQTRKKLELK